MKKSKEAVQWEINERVDRLRLPTKGYVTVCLLCVFIK
jgi:hypothetical protein